MLAQLLTYASLINAQGWIARMDGVSDDWIRHVTVDNNGNVYAFGSYSSSPLTIYNSAGQVAGSLTNSGASDAFLVKCASNGSFLWAARQGGIGNDYGQVVTSDVFGNTYGGGSYTSSSLNIYNAQGFIAKTLPNAGDQASYVVKYSSNGSFLVAVQLDGTGADQVRSLAVGLDNSLLVVGHHSSFPLVVYDAQDVSVKVLNNAGDMSAFGVKYLQNGSFVWAARQDGTFNDYAYSVSVDLQGSVYVGGLYGSVPLIIYDALDRNVKSLANTGGGGASFVVKYAFNGSFVWALRLDGSGSQQANALTCDIQGNVLVAGDYSSSPLIVYNALGVNVASLANSGPDGVFLVKFDGNGSFVWALRLDGSNSDTCYALVADTFGNVIVTGSYSSSPLSVYDINAIQRAQLANSGSNGAFVVKFSSAGMFMWAARQDGASVDYAYGLAVDSSNNLYVGGRAFSNPLLIYDANGVNIAAVANSGSYVAFLVKYNSDGIYNITKTTTSRISQPVSSSRISVATATTTLTESRFTSVVTSSTVSSKSTSITTFKSSGTIASLTVTSSTKTSLLQSTSSNTYSFSALELALTGLTSLSSSLGHLTQTPSSILATTPISTRNVIRNTASNTDITSIFVDWTRQTLVELLLTQNEPDSSSESTQFVKGANIVDSQNHLNQLVLNFILGAVGCVVVIVVATAFCCHRRLQRSNRLSTNYKEPNETDMGQSTSMMESTTAMVTSHVLAIPQFLALRFGVDIRQLDHIAQGGGGSIHFCSVIDQSKLAGYDGSKLVIKNLGSNVENLVEMLTASFYQEVSMMYLFRDQPQFAKMYGFTEQPATIVLKLYELGSLKQFIHGEQQSASKFRYSKRQALRLIVDITHGLSFMHSKQFVHCDVKPDNVLLESKNGHLEPRITDFGISRLVDRNVIQVKAFQLSSIRGASISYASPESIMRFRKRFNESDPVVWKAGDVYAFSIVEYELLRRHKVWN